MILKRLFLPITLLPEKSKSALARTKKTNLDIFVDDSMSDLKRQPSGRVSWNS